MTRKTISIILITTISIIELFIIKPIIPEFFGTSFINQLIYSITLFGFPLLIIIPIAILLIPFSLLFKRKKSFKKTWFTLIQNTFLIFGILILIINTILIISKFALNNDPFPLTKYSEIRGFEGNINDLKAGTFEYQFGVFTRNGDKQVEKLSNSDSIVLKIEWFSKNEYRLINQDINDTLNVKVTNNTPEYYECYLKHGEYAAFQKIIKK